MTPNEFVTKFYPYALESEDRTGVPASFILAQGALESGWGRAAIGNNIFGITASDSYQGKKVLVDTLEYHDTDKVVYPVIKKITLEPNNPPNKKYKYEVQRYFRDYDSPSDCFDNHNEILLQDNYKEAFRYKNDAKAFAVEIEKGGYATGYGYAKTLASIIDSVNKIITDAGLNKNNFPADSWGQITVADTKVRVQGVATARLVYSLGLAAGTKVKLLAQSGDMYKIDTERTGWVMSKYLAKEGDASFVNAKALNFRPAPGSTETLGDALFRRTVVNILKTEGEWVQVIAPMRGWVPKTAVSTTAKIA